MRKVNSYMWRKPLTITGKTLANEKNQNEINMIEVVRGVVVKDILGPLLIQAFPLNKLMWSLLMCENMHFQFCLILCKYRNFSCSNEITFITECTANDKAQPICGTSNSHKQLERWKSTKCNLKLSDTQEHTSSYDMFHKAPYFDCF